MARTSKDNPYGLTKKNQLFCQKYIINFNGTHAYKEVYGCTYNSAMVSSAQLLGNPRIKKEIKRIQKEFDLKSIVDKKTLLKRIVKIAFSDIGDYVTFDKQLTLVKSSEEVDTSLISEISQSDKGIKIKLIDQKWALNFLIRYFGIDPDSTHQKRYLDKRIELEEKKMDSDKNVDELKESIKNFLDSTKPNDDEINKTFQDDENENS